MSVSINFKTDKQLKAEEIFKALSDHGEKIVVTSQEFPYLKFGTFQEALRSIEINQEGDDYEVRVCNFANRADLHLFCHSCQCNEVTYRRQGYAGRRGRNIQSKGIF